ncbi:MAG: hypothetical protein SF182_01610 [Deltaproteobacteria bacterium]|nr:hypothetical protein [Deltaproteobacteria bacterium]
MGRRRKWRHGGSGAPAPRHDGAPAGQPPRVPAARGGGGYGRTARALASGVLPYDEHVDAVAEVYTRAAGELASELRDGDLDELQHETFALLNRPDVMAKAVRLEPGWYQASGNTLVGHPRQHSAILHINEFGVVDSPDAKSRWFEKPGLNGFTLLRDMAQVDILAAIDLTFIRQALRFMRPEVDELPQGLRIARVDGEKITDGEKPEVQRLERMLFNGGDVDDYFERRRLQRSDLVSFATKYLRDSLAADACPIELTRTPAGKLSGWHNVDFTTFRLCSEYGYEGRDEIGAVQLLDGVPQLAFEQRDFLYEIRNPRTDIRSGGYGYAENEMLLRMVTGYLNTVDFNLAGLNRNATPRGILTLIGKGIFNDGNQLDANKRLIQAMMTGPQNRFKFPMIAAEDGPGAIWTPMDQFDEMLFMRLVIFLVAIACAVKGCDPAALSFDSFSSRTSSLSGSDTEEKLSFSRNKGLLPVLDFAERIPSILVGIANPKYRAKLVGLHEEDEQRKHELIKLSSTTDEIRAMRGAEPLEDEVLGGAIAGNPPMMGLYMARQGVNAAGGDQGDEDGADDAPPRPKTKPRTREDDDAITKAAVVVIHRDVEA